MSEVSTQVPQDFEGSNKIKKRKDDAAKASGVLTRPKKKDKRRKKKKASQKIRQKAFWGLAHYIKNRGGEWVLRPRWKLLLPLGAIVLATAYLGTVGYLYWMHRYYLKCKETSLPDMFIYAIPNRIPFTSFSFLPQELDQYIINVRLGQREKLGNMLASSGNKNIYTILQGADLAPSNIEAQFEAAYVFAEILFRIDSAFVALDRTIPYIMQNKESAPKNLARYVQLCFKYDQDKRVIALAERYLPESGLNTELRIGLATAYAQALFQRGELEKANTVLEKNQLLGTVQGFILHIQIIWENGQQERAINKLLTYIRAGTEGRDHLLYQLARFFWEQGKKEDALETLKAIAASQPTDYKAYIYQLSLLTSETDQPRREALINTIISKFASNERAMLVLGSYSADAGDVALQDRISTLAYENRFPNLARFQLLLIETNLSKGNTSAALDQISNILHFNPTWYKNNEELRTSFNILRMITDFSCGKDELGKVAFRRIMEKDVLPMPMPMVVATARRLLKLNRPNEAKDILRIAYENNKQNQSILLELVKMDLKTESASTLGEHLTQFLDARRPPRYILNEAIDRLASDRFIFTPNRERLLADIKTMLLTRNLPQTEEEKGWHK
ncbi:MAG: hypothetical protein LBD01_01755 [Puniceicoccales bacterium]|jgi:hypothetical protein|nr:hypothetical protein [Puniceicoccales bacterium]